MAERPEPSSPRDRTGGRGIPGSAMAAPRQNASSPSLSHGCIGPERQPWPPWVMLPLPEVSPPSRRTGVATPESRTVAALDHVNHADEAGRCSTSYNPPSIVAPEAATCDIDLPPRHVTEDQEYDTTTMTGGRGREDDVIDSGRGADGEETQQYIVMPVKELLDDLEKAIDKLDLEADNSLSKMKEKSNEVPLVSTECVAETLKCILSFRVPPVVKGAKSKRSKISLEKKNGKKKKNSKKKGEDPNNATENREERNDPNELIDLNASSIDAMTNFANDVH